MIKPTIGSIVWFKNTEGNSRVPALITFVYDDACINIGGFDKHGHPFSAQDVKLVQGDEELVSIGDAEWPPSMYLVSQENSTNPTSNWLTRLEEEKQELVNRMIVMNTFCDSSEYNLYTEEEKKLVDAQFNAMERYAETIRRRLLATKKGIVI